MSFGLYYRPVPKEVPPATGLPAGLKHVIARRWFNHDGSVRGQALVTPAQVPYLEGLADAGVPEVSEGARQLIAAVKKHGSVELWIGEADEVADWGDS